MAGRITFKSLGDDQHAYALHETTYELSDQFYRAGGLAPWAGMFATYGHGIVQHTPEWPAPREQFEDYLASLAAYLLDPESPRRGEARQWMMSLWPASLAGNDEVRVRFLAGLKHNPEKRQWFHGRENKVSAAESRRHDRRWIEVPSYANGTAEGVYTMVMDSGYAAQGLIAGWAIYSGIRKIVLAEGGWGPDPAAYFKIGDRFTADQAFGAVDKIVEAVSALFHARRSLEAWQHNTAARREREAGQAAAIEAIAEAAEESRELAAPAE